MHQYFSPHEWGIDWPESATNVSHPPPPPLDHGFEVAMGPWFLLGGVVFGIVLNFQGDGIGYSACAWRVTYSPTSRAFRIWGLIYLWIVVSIILQLAHGFAAPTYIGVPQANYLMAASWSVIGFWGPTFTRGDVVDRPPYIMMSAFLLAAAAVLALTAVSIEQSWRSHNLWKMFGVGVPYALTAGWLTVAATVNMGLAYVSFTEPPDVRCLDPKMRREWEEEAVDDKLASTWVQVLVALAISTAAFLFPDPVLVLPAINGIYYSRPHLKRLVALEILVVTFVATIAQVATSRWVIKEVL